MEIISKVWPDEIRSCTAAIDLLKAVKQELGAAGRDLNFNAYSDQRSLFRYEMHTLPSEISSSIGTSTLLAAWNAAIYVAQIEDDRLVRCDRRPPLLDATRDVLQKTRRPVVLRRVFRDLSPARIVVPVMPAASPAPDPAGFARHFSLEATRPGAAEIATLADILPRGTPLYHDCGADT